MAQQYPVCSSRVPGCAIYFFFYIVFSKHFFFFLKFFWYVSLVNAYFCYSVIMIILLFFFPVYLLSMTGRCNSSLFVLWSFMTCVTILIDICCRYEVAQLFWISICLVKPVLALKPYEFCYFLWYLSCLNFMRGNIAWHDMAACCV